MTSSYSISGPLDFLSQYIKPRGGAGHSQTLHSFTSRLCMSSADLIVVLSAEKHIFIYLIKENSGVGPGVQTGAV